MFGLGKKKVLVSDENFYAPVTGEIMALENVADPVFAGKMMGDGFAIEPTAGQIVAPVSGKVTMIQGHALGIKREDGLEILLHLGIDTVSLAGTPFNLDVLIGQELQGGEQIGTADWRQVEAAGLQKTTLVIVTNSDALDSFEIKSGAIEAGELIGSAKAKG